jgi:hypothetical protein
VIADYVFPTGEFKMEERILPFYLYFSPDDTELGAHLGQVLREHGLEISWEGDEMAQELGINIQRPKAEINLFIWSRNAMQYGYTSGFPGEKATPQNYLLLVMDDELVPDDWGRFHRAILSGWDGDASDERLLNLVEALKEGDLSSLPDGILEVKKGPDGEKKIKTAQRDVPTHTDDAAVVDLLQRKPLARFLAEDLRRTRAQNMGSYVIHLHGPWGSGKTSLLNFIKTELRNPTPTPTGKKARWVVADFNAWQHQRFSEPWWWLMEAVSREALRALRFSRPDRAAWIFITNLAWQYLKGRTLSIIALIIFSLGVGGLIVIGVRALIPVLGGIDFKKATDIVVFISGIFAVAGVIGGAVIAVIRALRQGSTDAIRRLMDNARDPVRYLKNHFEKLVRRIKRPLAIVIDDLDRCESKYVVDLLEGVQTLFRDCPITFVIAADRRWVQGSYDSVYQGYESHMSESGRRLGQLFLEKIFQTSVPVPVMGSGVRERYFKYLIGVAKKSRDSSIKTLRNKARTALENTRSEGEVLEELGRHDKDPAFQQVFIEEAMARLASPEVVEHTEHVLENFGDLLESNPRAMKRFVNAYRVNRALDLAMRRSTASELLARWTIVSLRWPSLAHYLAHNPDKVADVVSSTSTNVPVEIRALGARSDVWNVIGKNDQGLILNKTAVRELAGELFPYAV